MICLECNEEIPVGPREMVKGMHRQCYHRLAGRERIKRNPEENNRRSREAHRKLSDAVGELKKSIGCIDCGYNEHAAALDFDHTEGKSASISKLRSMRRVLEEIDRHKCVVRCANCHRVKTHVK